LSAAASDSGNRTRALNDDGLTITAAASGRRRFNSMRGKGKEHGRAKQGKAHAAHGAARGKGGCHGCAPFLVSKLGVARMEFDRSVPFL
jgi:hypothetical protein